LLLLEDEGVSLVCDFGQNRKVIAAEAFGLLMANFMDLIGTRTNPNGT